MLMGTAMSSAMTEDTSVPKINGSAPNCSLTGSQSAADQKMPAEFVQRELSSRWRSSKPMSAMSTKMESAMSSVSHLKARSPKWRAAALATRSLSVVMARLVHTFLYRLPQNQKDEEREELRSSSGSRLLK